MCIFPAGYAISTRKFNQLWIAEGLIPHNNGKTAEDYLIELNNGGFIQVNKRSEETIKECSISSKVWVKLVVMAKLTKFDKVRGIDILLDESTSFSIFDNSTKFYYSEHSDTYLHFLMNSSTESRSYP